MEAVGGTENQASEMNVIENSESENSKDSGSGGAPAGDQASGSDTVETGDQASGAATATGGKSEIKEATVSGKKAQVIVDS